MKVRLGIALMIGLSLSACATVNMTELENATQSTAINSQPNVVLKASDRLSSRFSEKGWVEKTAFKMKSAAMALLRGNSASPTKTAQTIYAEKISPSDLKSDVVEATYLAQQTHKAADVYLEYVTADTDLTPDLKKLEKALLDCRQAEQTFEYAAKVHQVEIGSELSALNSASQKLQISTDLLGYAVRKNNSALTGQPIN